MTSGDNVRQALNATIETFGRRDFPFNNAGIEYAIKPMADVTEEEWDRIMNVDLRGVFLCIKHEIPLMLERAGAIVKTSSGSGIRGFKGGSAHVAAKHGVAGLTKAIWRGWFAGHGHRMGLLLRADLLLGAEFPWAYALTFGSRREQKLPGAAPAVPSKTADKKPDANMIEAKEAAVVATESAAADAEGKEQSS